MLEESEQDEPSIAEHGLLWIEVVTDASQLHEPQVRSKQRSHHCRRGYCIERLSVINIHPNFLEESGIVLDLLVVGRVCKTA